MGNKEGKSIEPPVLTPDHIALLKSNTDYSEQEIREWHTGFIRDCPSGKLTKKQFTEVYKQFCPEGRADKYCKYAFDVFDADGNGSIDFKEFLLALSVSSKANLDDRLCVAFNMYDTSDDGHIDQKELAKWITTVYDLVGETDRKGENDPKRRATEIMKSLDINGDRKLSKEEFISGCKNDPHIHKLLAPEA
ncbi:unnamed protein product [Rotaria sordida]|uniref:EF-hand domain-containing protein n=1 Tax=Rotaria sordida TaxID=392033 RepID=A0A813XT40_9BILA|nr:unnamed protein product [Rotaria sordida]CAF0877826.1 unnamed protein product [Rotaria sordida]CAF3771685.1 unnamed protein product [Rotaria sordida]CAF3829739.1 unnamed protein product [Rotaria sordida]